MTLAGLEQLSTVVLTEEFPASEQTHYDFFASRQANVFFSYYSYLIENSQQHAVLKSFHLIVNDPRARVIWVINSTRESQANGVSTELPESLN